MVSSNNKDSRSQKVFCLLFLLIFTWGSFGCAAAKRPSPPLAPDKGDLTPWGAVDISNADMHADDSFKAQILEGMRKRLELTSQQDPEDKIIYQVLLISGGGSVGAYGAGLLTGWTATGRRPEFEVVTGISTGALMATFAFLGPDYDHVLELYSQVTKKDIFKNIGFIRGLIEKNSLYDSQPLQNTIASLIDENTLKAVAEVYKQGRRLFIGTTNMDTNTFTVWDMGAIAASDRPGKLERYRKIILASAAFPIFFPPAYFMVEENGQQFSQMHMDGGLRESVFYFDFVEYLTEAEQALKIEQDQYASEVYLLHNGQLYARQEKIPVKPKVTEIAKSSVKALARKNTLSSIYRIYVQAMIHGVNFNIAFVPTEFDLPESSLEFDQKIMQQLFNLGHDMAIQGTAWQRQEAPEDPAERLRRIDPMEAIDPFDSKPKS